MRFSLSRAAPLAGPRSRITHRKGQQRNDPLDLLANVRKILRWVSLSVCQFRLLFYITQLEQFSKALYEATHLITRYPRCLSCTSSSIPSGSLHIMQMCLRVEWLPLVILVPRKAKTLYGWPLLKLKTSCKCHHARECASGSSISTPASSGRSRRIKQWTRWF